MKVMISSVRRGLEAERDSLPGLIMAMGHEPVRFEDFGAQPLPSREVCLRAVQDSDVYLLLLGPHYGHVFPETGQSATHDEFIAAQVKGMPRIIMKKTGVPFEPEQESFAKLVGDYGTGIFYDEFTDATDLQAKVVQKVRQLERQPTAVSFIPLPGPVPLEWRRDWETQAAAAGLTACLEVHILPVPQVPLSARAMNETTDHLQSSLRTSGAIPVEVGFTCAREPSGAAIVLLPEKARRFDEIDTGTLRGVRLAPTGQLSLWYTLPRDKMPLAVLDPDDLTARITEALRLAGRLQAIHAAHVAVAVGVDPTTHTTVGTVAQLGTRNSATFTRSGHLDYAHIQPDEAATITALDLGAAEVARAAADRLIDVVS